MLNSVKQDRVTERQVTCLSAPVKSFLANSFAPTQVTHRQEVGARIAQARREKGVRERRDVLRADLAEAVGVDPSTITAWEKGLKSPREEVLIALATYLGVTPAFLRYGVQAAYDVPEEPSAPRSGEAPTAPRNTRHHDVAAVRARQQAKRDGAPTKQASGDRSHPKRPPKPR
jgi:transcriptional regulator with XRE-family HTH domain